MHLVDVKKELKMQSTSQEDRLIRLETVTALGHIPSVKGVNVIMVISWLLTVSGHQYLVSISGKGYTVDHPKEFAPHFYTASLGTSVILGSFYK